MLLSLQILFWSAHSLPFFFSNNWRGRAKVKLCPSISAIYARESLQVSFKSHYKYWQLMITFPDLSCKPNSTRSDTQGQSCIWWFSCHMILLDVIGTGASCKVQVCTPWVALSRGHRWLHITEYKFCPSLLYMLKEVIITQKVKIWSSNFPKKISYQFGHSLPVGKRWTMFNCHRDGNLSNYSFHEFASFQLQ